MNGGAAVSRVVSGAIVFLGAVLAVACSRGTSPAPATPGSPAVDVSAREPRAPRADGRAPVAPARAQPATLDDVAASTDTFESLRDRYGADAVVRETLPGAEGDSVEGWVLFPRDRARRIEVHPDESGVHPAMLSVGEGSTWTRSDGVRIGLDTRALEALNGRPFEFAGFGWDYGGVVMDWKGGRLARDGRILGPVRLCDPEPFVDGYPTGDGEFVSDLAIVRAHPARVCELGVALGAAPAN